MSKIGTHILTGNRNGYGPFCDAKPAVVTAIGEGGALIEAKQRSAGHTLTIYRHNVWPDAPPGIDQTDEAGARAMADIWYPHLKSQWVLNPADYYTITNEGGGNNAVSLRNFVAYELRTLELAEAEGYKCCVLNYAAGQPHMNLWQEIAVPFIIRAWQGGHLYGRHVYGLAHGDLVVGNDLTPFALRPIEEIGHLGGLGQRGGVVITECGLDSGFNYDGQRFINQMQAYEAIVRGVPEIVGLCLWTLGHTWHNANWEDGIPAMIDYMAANPTPKWEWSEPGDPPTPLDEFIWNESQQRDTINEDAALQRAIFAAGFVPYSTEFWRQHGSNSYAIQTGFRWEDRKRIVAYARVPDWHDVKLIEGPEPVGFRLLNPVQGIPLVITTGGKFNAQRNYSPPFHEGLDLRATNSAGQAVNVLAAAHGVVDGIRPVDPGFGYGIYIRVRTVFDNIVYRVWYSHLQYIQAGLTLGSQVQVGQILGRAGSTGWSTGVHLHLTMQRTPGGLPGYIVDNVVDPGPYLGLPPTDLPGPGSPATLDLMPYIMGDGRLYEVRNADGGQERFQSQIGQPGEFFQTKNSQFEQLYFDANYIYRDLDTSPGGGRYYRLSDAVSPAGSRWVPRNWFVGGVFIQPRRVQFCWKDGCVTINEPPTGDVVDVMTFVARYPVYTFRTDITLPDVIQLLWENGGERYFYARGYGLVAWERQYQDPNTPQWSAISEVHAPGTRPDNVRETGCFSS